jgi:L-ascorbate metabolism protein UlaG (beta-lactamase superfamily)
MKSRWILGAVLAFALALGAVPALAQDVKITSLGSVTGELCALDRAILFEDPSGVNILIQPGRTVQPVGDPRLGPVHVVLLDHAHGDHMGDRAVVGCGGGGGTSLAPTPNVVRIASEKNSAILVGGEFQEWLVERMRDFRSDPGIGRCPTSGSTNLTEVDSGVPCVDFLRPGASREIKLGGAATGVRISTIQAVHANGISRNFVNQTDGKIPLGLTGYGGTENGYVIRFSTGLTVLWSGDSGFYGDMKLYSKFYGVNLAIMHIGDNLHDGPGRGRLRDQQAHQAQVGYRDARQRDGDNGWRCEFRQQDRALHQRGR